MSNLEFFQFPCLSDNYGVLIHNPQTKETASIDAANTEAVEQALSENGWSLTHILVTHHHYDHTDGIMGLKEKTNCKVFGPSAEADRIKGLDETYEDGDTFEFGGETVSVISTPGHTLGMINFHFPKSGVLFSGDTLFAMGCGRIFEGTPEMMWASMQKLMVLPPETVIYCGHEYTLANATFAQTVDPSNETLANRVKEVEALRAEGKPTIPTTLAIELETNPFLRAADKDIRAHLNMGNASDAEVFAEIRKRKDNA